MNAQCECQNYELRKLFHENQFMGFVIELWGSFFFTFFVFKFGASNNSINFVAREDSSCRQLNLLKAMNSCWNFIGSFRKPEVFTVN